MRLLDRLLQHWRARMARPWIPKGAKVLDIGCHQGEFLKSLRDRIGPSVGMDPWAPAQQGCSYRLLPQPFRSPAQFPDSCFDVVVLLATLEHIPDKEPLARECFRLLAADGRLVLTVPSLLVDGIVALLCRLRLADGMSLEEHHGFNPRQTLEVFRPYGFALECRRSFQFGLNHLFVFRKEVAGQHNLIKTAREQATC